jgi:hypothetical protein
VIAEDDVVLVDDVRPVLPDPHPEERTLRLPLSGADSPGSVEAGCAPDRGEAYVPNPFFRKELLTRIEALDCINLLAGALIADERIRSRQAGD